MKPFPYPKLFKLNLKALSLAAGYLLTALLPLAHVDAAVEITDAKVFLQGGVATMDEFGEPGWSETYWDADPQAQKLPGALGSHTKSYEVSARSPSGTSAQLSGSHSTVMAGASSGLFFSSKSAVTATTTHADSQAYAEAYVQEEVWLFFTNDAPISYNVQISGTNDYPSYLSPLRIVFAHRGGAYLDFSGGTPVSSSGVLDEGETSITIRHAIHEQHSGTYNVSLTVGPSAVVLSPVTVTNNQLVIPAAATKPGATYTLEGSSSPKGGWAHIQSKPADGDSVEFRVSIGDANQKFFRVLGPPR
jgi:hypothetical protein